METLVTLSVALLNTSHKDLDYLPLANKDFQIKDLITDKNITKVFFQSRDNYLNGFDIIGLWESNLPMYFLHSFHFHANYDPNRQAVMSLSQIVLFQ